MMDNNRMSHSNEKETEFIEVAGEILEFGPYAPKRYVGNKGNRATFHTTDCCNFPPKPRIATKNDILWHEMRKCKHCINIENGDYIRTNFG